MKILFLILVATFTIPCYAQINGWVYDENKNPINYASVIILDEQQRGAATDEKGFFSIDTKSIARLYVSSVGFYDTIIPVSCLKQKMKIMLRTRTYMLPEVVVTSSNLKPIILGIFKQTPTKEDIRPTGQIGIFYETKRKDINRTITSIKLYIDKTLGVYNAPMSLRILGLQSKKIKHNKLIFPTEVFDVLPELIRFQAERPGWYEINLSEYDAVIPEHGFFLFVEALERVEKYQWWKNEKGDALYGAWVSNNPMDYKPFELALINIDKDRPGYHILKSPLLRNSKPMILINLR